MSDALSVRIGLRSPSFELEVAFEAHPGVTVLFGPSGSGKSRTLGCIAGIVRPDRGRIALGADVWFDDASRLERRSAGASWGHESGTLERRSAGASWRHESGTLELAIHRRRVAYVFQSLALFPHMTALENVGYGIDRKVPEAEREARAHEMLTRMRIPHLSDRRPRTFSGGEAQRVALARAFAMSPKVLLLDEPFSALDAGVKMDLLAEVREWLERERLPSILVTHHEEEASALGDRVVMLEKGRVVREAAIDDPTLSLPKIRAAAK